jgi:protocatechuate 3,4-dioxygenase beta subunit
MTLAIAAVLLSSRRRSRKSRRQAPYGADVTKTLIRSLCAISFAVLAACAPSEEGKIPCDDASNCPSDFSTCSAAKVCVASANPASITIVSGNGQTGVAGQALTSPFVVEVKDSNGNDVSGFVVTWAVTAGGGSVGAASTTTGADGKATTTATLGTAAGANTFTASGAGLTAAIFTATATPNTAVALAIVSGNNQTANAGTVLPAPLVVKVTDVNGNGVSGISVSWAVAAGGGSLSASSATTAADGTSQVTATLAGPVGINTFTASVAALTPPSVTFTETGVVGPAAVLAISAGNNQTAAAGTALPTQLRVLATDAHNNPVTGFTVNWAVSTGGGNIAPSAPLASVTNASGLASTTAVILGGAAGVNTFTASGTGVNTVTFTETGVPGPAANLAINGGDNQTATAGSTLPTQLSVKVTDAQGNPVSGFSIAWAATTATASVTPATSTTNASGIASTTSVKLATAVGPNTFTATGTGLTPPVEPFHATGVVGAATTLVINAGDNQTGTAGAALPTALSVKVTDTNGNPISGFTVNWLAATGGGSVAAPTSTSNVSGIASISATLGATAGPNTFTASGTGVNSVTFNETGVAGTATTLTLNAGDNQTGAAGAALPIALSVKVTDTNGNLVSGFTVHWAATAGGGSVASATSTSNASGIASIVATLGGTVGPNTFTASGTGVNAITFHETGVAGTATTLAVNAGDNQTATVGTTLPTALSVKVTDTNGNPVSGFTVNWAAATGGGSVATSTSTSGASGIASVLATLGTTTGANTFTASGTGVNTITFHATGTAGPAATLTLNAGDNQTATAGTALPTALSVKVTDANNNVVSGFTVNWAAATGGGSVAAATSTSNASGIASIVATLGNIAGPNTFTASGTGVNTITFHATGVAGTATTLTVNAGDSQAATAGTALPIALSVKVTDANNNVVSGFTVHWAAASGGGSVAAATSTSNAGGIASIVATLGTTAGPNSFTASGTGVNTVTFNETATAGAATALAVNAGDNQTGTAGNALPTALSVKVTDTNGNPVNNFTVNWAAASGGGSVASSTSTSNSSGIASIVATLGNTAGANTFTASGTGVNTITFHATGGAGAAAHLTKVAITDSQTAAPGTALPLPLQVTVTDAHNNPVSGFTVGWAATAGGGSVASATSQSDGTGIAQITATLGGAAGPNTFSASGTGVTTVVFTETGAGAFGGSTTLVVGGSLDGSVFIAGGNGRATSIYQPATGKSVAGPDLSAARALHTTTALGGGQVLIAGGNASGGATFEICSFGASSSCSAAGGMTARRCNAAAARAGDGVLIASGDDCSGNALASWDLWTAGKVTSGQLSRPRASLTATALPDGSVLLAGGGTAELFHAGSVSALPPMLAVRAGHTATLLGQGSKACASGSCVLLAGGVSSGATWEIFDVASGSFGRPSGATEMIEPSRALQAAALLADGRVMLAGGTANAKAIETSELFDGLRFVSGPALQTARTGVASVYVPALDLLLLAAGSEAPEMLAAP